jgi:hypothetical protein
VLIGTREIGKRQMCLIFKKTINYILEFYFYFNVVIWDPPWILMTFYLKKKPLNVYSLFSISHQKWRESKKRWDPPNIFFEEDKLAHPNWH